jgi:excisionase family DNA binding protein
MKHYSIHIELDIKDPSEERIHQLRDFLDQAGFSPAVGTSPRGWLDAQVTATNPLGLVQAIMATTASVQQLAGAKAIAIEAMPEDEFDARQPRDITIPELVTVAQAAELLGVTRQRVLQMIAEHKFTTATRVGEKTLVIAYADVLHKLESDGWPKYDGTLPDGITADDVARTRTGN